VRSLALVIENQSAESGVSSLAVLRRCGSASSIYPPATLIAPRQMAGATYVIWPYFTDDRDTIVGMRSRRNNHTSSQSSYQRGVNYKPSEV